MDIEGRDNPRDVVGGKKMHPWEVFPENEKLSNKKKKNKNRKIIFVIFIILILIGGGVATYFVIKNLNSGNEPSPEDEYEPTAYEKAMDTTIEEAQTEQIAFYICTNTISEVMRKGYDNKTPSILEDNLQAFLKEQKSEYLKNIYEMCGVVYLSHQLQFEYAENHLKSIGKLDINSLDSNQLYAYYSAYNSFYMLKGDTEKGKKYGKLLNEKFPEETQHIYEEDWL